MISKRRNNPKNISFMVYQKNWKSVTENWKTPASLSWKDEFNDIKISKIWPLQPEPERKEKYVRFDNFYRRGGDGEIHVAICNNTRGRGERKWTKGTKRSFLMNEMNAVIEMPILNERKWKQRTNRSVAKRIYVHFRSILSFLLFLNYFWPQKGLFWSFFGFFGV